MMALWFVMLFAAATAFSCNSTRDQDIRIDIVTRRRASGQLTAQIKVEESCNDQQKRSPCQEDIAHDSACSSTVTDLNPPSNGSLFNNKREPPRPHYEFVPGLGYYKFHNKGKRWQDAKLSCEQEGAHLAIINSQKELDVLLELWQRLPKLYSGWKEYNILIGMTDAETEGKWITIFGKAVSETGFNVWHPDQPSGGTGSPVQTCSYTKECPKGKFCPLAPGYTTAYCV
ncbi:hemolymph lipopolysaccharide-binding protein-like [Periplaneta americana]|uniref:hemolymph lipopolysaccharide-binding protein-like n=1 Tax=Periplaneta americana TaxID=6978 RepID=UPI0037E87F0C